MALDNYCWINCDKKPLILSGGKPDNRYYDKFPDEREVTYF
jgi:hypothetical protein